MTSQEFVRAKLVSMTNADCSTVEAKNNRAHYYLKFDNSIGWEWIETQIYKVNGDLDLTVELYKINPSGMDSFEVEVRELQRRENIDSSQIGLTDFEK